MLREWWDTKKSLGQAGVDAVEIRNGIVRDRHRDN
jgi:hypothetical protein